MPDSRQHRGPHPEDDTLFNDAAVPTLREAVRDLSWLLSHQYAENSALKLVGDRYRLSERQRLAVRRSSCSDKAVAQRATNEMKIDQLKDHSILIDGFNLLTTIEAALSGAVLICGRDRCYRDMASMHGNYRKVAETRPALKQIGKTLSDADVASAHWLLDSPVSNSGRLGVLIREVAEEHGWNWSVDLVANPDRNLMQSNHIVITADSVILDHCRRWASLARFIVDQDISDAWLIRLDIDEVDWRSVLTDQQHR